jgi:hypothetical protein
MRHTTCIVLGVALSLCIGHPCFGQHANSVDEVLPAASVQPEPGALARWVDVQSCSLSFRDKAFRPYTTEVGPWYNQVQYSANIGWSFKVDSRDRFTLDFVAATGRAFISGWNNTGVGPYSQSWKFFVRQASASARPVRGVELRYGGLGVMRGDWSDITDLSNNGYLMGERVRITRPDTLFFDEVSTTAGALKDLDNPDVFARFHRLNEVNYYQVVLAKRVAHNVRLSGGYDSYDGTGVLHQAIKVTLHHRRNEDSVTFENYERLGGTAAWGFALIVQGTISRVSLSGGVSSVDKDFVPLNSERLGRGHRVFVVASHPIWHELSFNLAGTKSFRNTFPIAYETRLDAYVSYDVAKALRHIGVF